MYNMVCVVCCFCSRIYIICIMLLVFRLLSFVSLFVVSDIVYMLLLLCVVCASVYK